MFQHLAPEWESGGDGQHAAPAVQGEVSGCKEAPTRFHHKPSSSSSGFVCSGKGLAPQAAEGVRLKFVVQYCGAST